jgi:hypothetical protein
MFGELDEVFLHVCEFDTALFVTQIKRGLERARYAPVTRRNLFLYHRYLLSRLSALTARGC